MLAHRPPLGVSSPPVHDPGQNTGPKLEIRARSQAGRYRIPSGPAVVLVRVVRADERFATECAAGALRRDALAACA